MQEIQERPDGRRKIVGVWGGAPPRTPISESANQPISGRFMKRPEMQERQAKRTADETRESSKRTQKRKGWAR